MISRAKKFFIWICIAIVLAASVGICMTTIQMYPKFDRREVVATSLPTMFIDLYDENGNTYALSKVNREEYVSSKISITNTDVEYQIDSKTAEFKGRGNGSWFCDKKGYRLKFDKKISLFGRAKNKNWVLNACANFDDRTMYRNYLAYNMASSIFDGIEYTTKATWIDVYVNGLYQGVYVLCEHVRVDEGRVDIESEYGVDDTGFLIEYDAYATGVEGVDYFRINGVRNPFTIHSPDPADYASKGNITTEEFMSQVEFIQNYVQSVYSAALSKDFETFSSLVDIDSFVDMYILHELFKNTDTGHSSFYLYKKPSGKLYAGPAWDFDGTTTAARGSPSPEGIYVAGESVAANELFVALYSTAGFRSLVDARWQVLSDSIQEFIDENMNDSVYEENKFAMARNLALWKKLSMKDAEKLWLNEVDVLKNWFDARISYLNNEWV